MTAVTEIRKEQEMQTNDNNVDLNGMSDEDVSCLEVIAPSANLPLK